MKALSEQLDTYLAMRRALGYRLVEPEHQLRP